MLEVPRSLARIDNYPPISMLHLEKNLPPRIVHHEKYIDIAPLDPSKDTHHNSQDSQEKYMPQIYHQFCARIGDKDSICSTKNKAYDILGSC